MQKKDSILDIQEFGNLEFLARQIVEGFITGLHRSPFHGFSVEFAEHRLYNKGESTKHIDWKLYARTDKVFVKRYEEETNLRCQIVIDTSSSMLYPYKEKKSNKLTFSALCAASLIHLLRKQRDAVGLSLFTDEVNFQSECKISQLHAQYLYNQLTKLISTTELNNKTNTTKALHQIAENTHKRSLILIFSDMLNDSNEEEIFSALQHLKHNKHEVILFHVTDHKFEKNFNFENRPYRFVDMETGEELKLNPNDVRDSYLNGINKYFNQLKLKCAQYQIDVVEADINDTFQNILLTFLVKRNKLF